jgi:hypothetical protein
MKGNAELSRCQQPIYGDEIVNTARSLLAGVALMASVVNLGMAKDCTWTVSGTVKVKSQEPELIAKFGEIIPLKGIKVKISGATIGWFDEWGTVTTDAEGKFSLRIEKGCDDRKLKIEVKFQSDNLELRYAHSTSDLLTDVKWYTIVQDEERRRQPGDIQILPTVFDAGKPNDLSNSEARSHADLWIIANTLREQLAGYGSNFTFKDQIAIKYPHNSDVVNDNVEASYTNPTTQVVYIYKSNDGREDHLNVQTVFHEMMHKWAFQHCSGELDLATNLIFTGSTHCANEKEHISFHEAFAEFAMERLYEEIFGKPHTLPYNRDALKEGLSCEGSVDRINTLRDMEVHEFGWMSLFRMLTTKDLQKYTYAAEASSSDPSPYSSGNSSVFISIPSGAQIAYSCSNPMNFTLKDILNVFLPHSSQGFGDNLKKSEMNFDSFLNRAGKILGFSDKVAGIKNLLDPSKTTEPHDELCSGVATVPIDPLHR